MKLDLFSLVLTRRRRVASPAYSIQRSRHLPPRLPTILWPIFMHVFIAQKPNGDNQIIIEWLVCKYLLFSAASTSSNLLLSERYRQMFRASAALFCM